MSSDTLTAVPIFMAGVHRGRPYTEADLDAMVENFRASSVGDRATLRVPAVLGHEESQELLRRSDLPAAAWASRIYRRGLTLFADFEHVPEAVMRLLRAKAYRTVSAEVYDRPPAGVPGAGRMLRRVAFLGGDIPQIKTLGDIPLPDALKLRERFDAASPVVLRYSDSAPCTGAYAIFHEAVSMDRPALIEALAKFGLDTSKITDAVPDEVLAEMARACEAKADPTPSPALAPDAASRMSAFVDGLDDEKMPDFPEPKDKEEAEKFRGRSSNLFRKAKKWAEMCGAKMDDEPDTKAADTKKPEAPTMNMSEINAAIEKAVQAAIRTNVAGSLGELNKFREETLAGEKTRAVDAFVERMGSAGKLPPAERDSVRARLLRADSRPGAVKFAEGGKTVELSELDAQMREIQARPSFFGERFRDPASTPAGDDQANVERFYEERASAFALSGITKDKFVETWKKADPASRRSMLS